MTKEIPLTQGKVALVDDEDYARVNSYKWHTQLYRGGCYAVRQIKTAPVQQIYMHRFIMDAPNGLEIDHKNGNGLDNRRSNLRICTESDNRKNRKLNYNNVSGYKGVYWDKKMRKWRAKIKVNRRTIHLGSFTTPESASLAYSHAANALFGKFVRTEQPE